MSRRDELIALAETLQSVGKLLFLDANKGESQTSRSRLMDASCVSNLQAAALRALAEECGE